MDWQLTRPDVVGGDTKTAKNGKNRPLYGLKISRPGFCW